MNKQLELMKGSDNPFRDMGLADPDTKLMKADLAAEIIRVMRENELTGTAAAKLASVQSADISRIRNADLARFTVDRLVKILNQLDTKVMVTLAVGPRVPRSGIGHHPDL